MDGALYRAMEFNGDTVRGLTMANMAIEAGARTGSVPLCDGLRPEGGHRTRTGPWEGG
ncbi:MAG: hypothetical protein AB1558_13020 [Thermodesulfobacteriota bacterium]